MEAKVVAKYLKVGPQKARLVVNQIRGKKVGEAMKILTLSDKAVSKEITKALKSVMANAENNHDMDVDSLFVKSAFADGGPVMKRMRPRAQGRGFTIRKRSSHITIVLGDDSGK